MVLSFPLMCITCNGAAWWVCNLNASARRRCPAIVDVAVLFFWVQLTAASLSQWMPMCLCCSTVGVIFSRTSQANSIPAVSMSLIDIVPCGFVFDTKFAWISAGHCTRHTVGWIFDVPGVHTPPTPVPDASTKPI